MKQAAVQCPQCNAISIVQINELEFDYDAFMQQATLKMKCPCDLYVYLNFVQNIPVYEYA